MRRQVKRIFISFLPLVFLVFFSSSEFFLLLRHKSPYISDSYFYKHIFYEFGGDSFVAAYGKILRQIDFSKTDEISRNFYLNVKQYQDSLRFFTKRPLYPFLGLIGIGQTFIISKKPQLIDTVLLASGVTAYLAIFLYPVLSYRFFIPTVAMLVYFTSRLLYPVVKNAIGAATESKN